MIFNILDRSLNVFATKFLEASAGTGKTFAIEHLFVRLLIDSENPLSLSDILVVTFTRDATRELKQRIRLNCEKALRALQSGKAEFDYLQRHVEGDIRRAIFRLKNALACLDEMQIFTIHGFCFRMLSEYALDAKESIQLGDPDSSQYKGVLRSVVEDFFRTSLHSSSYSAVQLHYFLKKYGYDFSKVSTLVLSLIEKGIKIKEYPSFESQHLQFIEKIARLPPIKVEFFMKDFEGLSFLYKKMTNPEFITQGQLLGRILETKSCSSIEFDQLLKDKDFFLENVHEGNKKIRPKAVEWHYPGLFQQLHAEIYPLISEAKDPLILTLRMAKECRQAWEEKADHLLPDDLLKKMASCLDNPLFYEKVQKRYQAAIIDEFQDTDPRQWEIFERLFVDKAKVFYLVGDPKQSIYAFRNADIKTYSQAKMKIAGNDLAHLETNFRSDPDLVKALNTLFLVFPQWLKGIEFLPVQAGKQENTLLPEDQLGRIHFFIAEGENGSAAVLEETCFLPFIVSEICKLKQYGSMAILVKDRYQAARVQAFLKKWNIPTFVKRAHSLFDSPAYPSFRDLLVAILNPRDISAVKRALASPLFGWSAEEIEKGAETASFETMNTLFQRWHHLLKEKGIGVLAGSIIEHCPLDPDWYEAFRQWIELLLTSKEDPRRFLKNLEKQDPEMEEQFQCHSEEEEGKVLIMTTHVSKGLEFDIVFALGLASRHEKQEELVNINQELKRFDPDDPACHEALQLIEEEKLRQFYVALTRAKKRVYVAWVRDLDGSMPNSPCELFFQFWNKDVIETLKNLENISYSFPTKGSIPLLYKEKMETIEQPSLTFPEGEVPGIPLYLDSFSSMAKKTATETVEVSEEVLPKGAETGNILHKIIERFFNSEKELKTIIREETVLSSLSGWEDTLFSLISPLLKLPLQTKEGKTFCLEEIPKELMFQEMEFHFSEGSQITKGLIDLVFIHEGKYYFIDWKSNLLPEYSFACMQKAMEDHDYFLQASLYIKALQKYFGSFSLEYGGGYYIFLRNSAIFPIEEGDLC